MENCFGRMENYFDKWGNDFDKWELMECKEFILPDWSPSDDPARVLAAEGRRNPSNDNNDDLISASCKPSQFVSQGTMRNTARVCLG